MKKQILTLTLFVLAVFAGLTESFGQTYTNYLEGAAECVNAQALTCISTEDALHPLPGEVYTYSVNVNPGTVGSIHWFVTDESQVIYIDATTGLPTLQGSREPGDGSGSYILTAGGEYDVASNTSNTIDISWKTFDGITNEVLLVAYVTDQAGCTDNVEVYRIQPTFGFTLDIAALADGGTIYGSADAPTAGAECVSLVESATYDGTNLVMDYGENWIFFTVNAANFVDSWSPTFTTDYTGAGTVGAVQWAYPSDALSGDAANWHDASDAVEAQAASGTVGAAGECIVLRVQIDHANEEIDVAAGQTTLTMGVDGTMYDPANDNYTNTSLQDLDEPTSGTGSCVNNITDEIDYNLTPRPEINTNTEPGTADQDFVPKN